MLTSIHQSAVIYKYLKEMDICRIFTHRVIQHMMSILITVFTVGYRGKCVQMAQNSNCHRTTIAHFLNHGKWDDGKLETIIKSSVIKRIYEEAARTDKPIYCIVDDTISSKTKPSSRATHPIEDASFHQSHLKGKQDYGHQAVAVMLSCNGITLNYAVILYNKSKSKIQIVKEIAEQLPIPPVKSYFLCDSWYTCGELMDAFMQRGFYTIGALKTNRILYPKGIKQSIAHFATHLQKTDATVCLVTVGGRQYYVYRYEGNLNGVENAVVLICYPKDSFHNPKALRAFISTNSSLSTEEILDIYTQRWNIEVFFRNCKSKLAFDQYQIRSATGIRRFWLIMSLAYFFCCDDNFSSFEVGFSAIQSHIHLEHILFWYQCGQNAIPLQTLLPLVS